MKETFYFSHDYNATNDPKICYLMSKCGLEGLGLYWILIETLHQENTGKIKKNLLPGISYKFNIDITLFNTVIDTCIEAELFKLEENYLFSERVLRNKKELDNYRESKSKAGKVGMAKRWGKYNTVITENNTAITNDNKLNEIKGNEIKENTNTESRFAPPTISEIQSWIDANGYTEVTAERFHSFYESKNWMVGKNKMKNWKAAVTGWNTRSKTNSPVYERRKL